MAPLLHSMHSQNTKHFKNVRAKLDEKPRRKHDFIFKLKCDWKFFFNTLRIAGENLTRKPVENVILQSDKSETEPRRKEELVLNSHRENPSTLQ